MMRWRARVRRARIKTYLSTMYTRDRVQGLGRSNRAHETPMRSRRFVALFGGERQTGQGNGGAYRTGGQRGESRGKEGRYVVAIWKRPVAGGTSEGTARHASARAAWRETIRANNRQEAHHYTFLAGSRNNDGTQPRSFRGDNEAGSRARVGRLLLFVIGDARGCARRAPARITRAERTSTFLTIII